MTKKTLKVAGIVAGVALLGVLAVATSVEAASYFSGTVSTSAATSTPAYMTPGNATSTLTYNTLTNSSNATASPSGTAIASKADAVYLAGQFTGSSTSAVLHIYPEYSQDGYDWYQGYGLLGAYSTTTPNMTFAWSYTDEITIPYASTTVDQTSTSSIDRFLVRIPVPTKDVRLVITLTGANAAFWGEVIPVKTN